MRDNYKVRTKMNSEVYKEDISFEWGASKAKIKKVTIKGNKVLSSSLSPTLIIVFCVSSKKKTVSFCSYDYDGDYVFVNEESDSFDCVEDVEKVATRMWRVFIDFLTH